MAAHITTTFSGIGVAPSLLSVSMNGSIIAFTYSEPMDPTTSTNTSNYTFTGGPMTKVSATMQPLSNDSVVLMTVSGFTPATSYHVVVSGVKDKAGNLIV